MKHRKAKFIEVWLLMLIIDLVVSMVNWLRKKMRRRKTENETNQPRQSDGY